MRPICRVASSPIFFQVFPPSRDLYAPSPQEELWRLFGSPVPTHTTAGSDAAIAISPIVDTPSLSNTGSQVVPLLVVFQTPPEAVPTYTMFGLLSTTAKSSMRPPIVAGPISRNSRALNLSVGLGWSPGADRALPASAPRLATQTRTVRKVLHVSFISILPVCKARHVTPAGPLSAAKVFDWQHNPVKRETGQALFSFHGCAIHSSGQSLAGCISTTALAFKSLRPHARL